MSETTTLENPEDEIILGESVSEDARRIRVYMPGGDDFVIEVPAKAKVTFGYFNPGIAGSSQPNQFGRYENDGKKTSLRIYEAGEKSNQLACFMGAIGFRDYRIKKTKLVQKVVVERRYADDGEGNEDWSGKRQAELTVSTEDDTPF